MQLTPTQSSIAKFCLTVLIGWAIIATATLGYVQYQKRQDLIEEQQAIAAAAEEKSQELAKDRIIVQSENGLTLPPPPPTAAAVSVNGDGVSIVIPEDTSWKTILQIIVLVLCLYGGIRVINRFTPAPQPN